MVIAESKPLAEILDMVKDFKKIVVPAARLRDGLLRGRRERGGHPGLGTPDRSQGRRQRTGSNRI